MVYVNRLNERLHCTVCNQPADVEIIMRTDGTGFGSAFSLCSKCARDLQKGLEAEEETR